MYAFIQGIKDKIKQRPIDEKEKRKNRPNYRNKITMGKMYLKFKY